MIQNAINQLLYMLSCYEGVKLMVQSDNLYLYPVTTLLLCALKSI